MSVRVMAWVWSGSRSAPTQRLVLLAIADCANDRGTDAYPSTETLAAKTGLSTRGVRKAIAELEKIGELKVGYKAGPRGCNRYSVLLPDPEQGAGNPAPQSTSDGTRNDVHSAPHATYTRNDVPGTWHETTGNPARGAPEPSENHPPSEPSGEPSDMSPPRKRGRRPPKPPPDRPDVEKICDYLADRMVANGCVRPNTTDRWRREARLLLDVDGRGVENVLRAIDWALTSDFWAPVIKSPTSLRKHYDTMRQQAARGSPPNGKYTPYRNPTDPNAYTEGL